MSNRERLTCKVWRGGDLILTVTMPPNITIREFQRHVDQWKAKGCTVTYKRLPLGVEDLEEGSPRGKGVRK